MSIASEITRLQTAKADIKAAIEDKGVTVPSGSTLDDFADLVEAIQTGGGGIDIEDIAKNTFLSGAYVLDCNLYEYAFDHKGKSSTPWTMKWMGTSTSGRSFSYTRGLTMLVITHRGYYTNPFYDHSTELATLDTAESRLPSNAWSANSSLSTVILRSTSVVTLNNVNSVSSGTPFKSGGSGGTIYIPKSLYDHLGDGTSSDYKAATNWSTADGYGVITWAAIEGSQYENYYADGTPISA